MSQAAYEAVALWSEVLASVLFIVAMMYIYRRWVAPAVAAAEVKKNAELLEGERRRNEAREQVTVAQRQLETAQAEVAGILERARADGQRERDRILGEARVEGERLIHNANGELTRGRASGREAYRDELLREALTIASAKASQNLDADANMTIVNRVLSAVESNVAAA